MYIMLSTRPDLAFAVQKLSSFSSNPSVDHHRAIARVFGYLSKTQYTVMDMVIFRTIFFELLVFFTFTLLTIHFAY